MSLKLTQGQEQALGMVRTMLAQDKPCVGIITGFAGCGKTTLIGMIGQEFGEPIILTPTGKSSLRVTEATGLPAMTIHRWLYKCNEDDDGTLHWTLANTQDIRLSTNRLVVVDEASMMSERIWEDLWCICQLLNLKVLLIGDKFQLPPVAAEISWSVLTNVHTPYRVELTEVLRQALDNSIIAASMMIRASESQAMEAIARKFPIVKPSNLLNEAIRIIRSGGVVICHRNITRHDLNNKIRGRLGLNSNDLVKGEPLLVLQNNYDVNRFNGEIVTFNGWEIPPGQPVPVVDKVKVLATEMAYGVANIENFSAVVSVEEIMAKTGGLRDSVIRQASKRYAKEHLGYRHNNPPTHLNANFGYTLTCSKAQGSEWPEVLVIIESGFSYLTLEGRRWIYTSVTRSKYRTSLCFLKI